MQSEVSAGSGAEVMYYISTESKRERDSGMKMNKVWVKVKDEMLEGLHSVVDLNTYPIPTTSYLVTVMKLTCVVVCRHLCHRHLFCSK